MDTARAYKNEHGVALVISLMFLAILSMLGTTAYVMTTTDLSIGKNYMYSSKAFFDADAGINYGRAKIESEYQAGNLILPTVIGNHLNPSDTNSKDLSSLPAFTIPPGFNFSFRAPGLTLVSNPNPDSTALGDNVYQFTCVATSTNNSSATITATMKFKPAIQFGAFGDKKLDLGNTAAVYSYSHSSNPSPTPEDSTGNGDVGSNESVILRNHSIVDGDTALGEDAGGNDATLTDHGGIVSGTNGDDIDRVDPDPLGVVGGEYASKFTSYSTCSNSTLLPPPSATNDNCCYDGNPSLASHCYLGDPYAAASPQALVYGELPEDFDFSTNKINLRNNHSLTLKGKDGGANYYISDIRLNNSSTLYIDTTHGPVNIFLTGEIDAVTSSNFVNTTEASCIDSSGNPVPCCVDGSGNPCSCICLPGSCTECVDGSGNPCTFNCSGSCTGSCPEGAPSDFAIFSNSQNSTDKISIGNSVKFSGLIYAPYITVEIKNGANIYGAIVGREVEIKAASTIYYDTDIADRYTTNNFEFTSWREVRN